MSNYKVYTQHHSNNKVITFNKFPKNVITKYTHKHQVITKLLLYYIVITFTSTSYALTFDSDLTEGQLIYGKADKNEEIYIPNNYLNIGKNDKNLFKIPTTSTGEFVLGIPQDAKELTLYINNKEKKFPVKPQTWDEEYVNGLPPQKVSPNTKNQERITNESLLMRQARQSSTYPEFPKKWINPVPNYKRFSSFFGSRRILNNQKKQGHSGLDIAAPTGTPIIAPNDGKVTLIHQDMFLTGKTILIDHGYGVFSSYSHLDNIKVKLNQIVKTREIIGTVGQTGRSTGPHLHWTVTWYGVRVNPLDLIK